MELASSVQVGRQGIYDRDRNLVAFEMLFRSVMDVMPLASEGDHERATSQVIGAVFGDFGVAEIAGSRPLFVNVTRAFLVGDLPLPDAPDQLVIEVLEHVVLDAAVMSGIATLRARGFKVALDDWAGEASREDVLSRVDVVKISLGDIPLSGLPRLVAAARRANPSIGIVLEQVEDEETFAAAHDLGIDLFQGYLLQRPQVIEAPQLAPSELMCLRLLGALAAEEVNSTDVEHIVASDPGLAVRVLRTASSAGGAGRPVGSLRQALALLGPKTLSSWVVLMLVGGTGRVAQEHIVTLLARAGTCAAIVPQDPEAAYITGLLSGVSEILGVSAGDTVRTTGVGDEVAAALERGAGSLGAALSAIVAYERGDAGLMVANGFSPLQVSRAYLGALRDAMITASVIEQ